MTERILIRYRLAERLMHALAALSYVYLLVSGLAFWTPGLYWLAALSGGGYSAREWHPIIGLAFSVAVAWMYGVWRRDMRATAEDRAWRRAIGRYVRNEDASLPAVGRFNFGQKQLFWVMSWGAVALLLSGVVLWFPDRVPRSLIVLRPLAVLLHSAAALATIAGFIVHVYMGVAVVPGGVHAIVRGTVTERWARRHHALWAREVAGEASVGSGTGNATPGGFSRLEDGASHG